MIFFDKERVKKVSSENVHPGEILNEEFLIPLKKKIIVKSQFLNVLNKLEKKYRSNRYKTLIMKRQ
jgi:plasmid maintenance system antidote protein VapI